MSERALERAFRRHCPGTTRKGRPGEPDRLVLLPDGRVRWVELKYLARWPPRGLVRLGVKRHQALFLRGWERHGGRGWLLVRVADDHLLFDPEATWSLVDGATVEVVRGVASRVWVQSPWDELWEIL